MTPVAFFAAVKKLYDLFREISDFFDPDPTTAELIEAAKDEIIHEIQNVVAQEYIAQVSALIEEYTLYQLNPTENRLGFLDTQSVLTINYLAESINNGQPRTASLLARAYNLLAPLRATVMKLVGDSEEQIDAFLHRTIDVNHVLLGPYRFDELPNVPVYIESPHSKILQSHRAGDISLEDANGLLDFVWSCNEEVRTETIPGYPDDITFVIKWRYHDLYLCANGNRVTVSPLPQSTDASFLWRFRFSERNATQIVSIDQGYCLEFLPSESDNNTGLVSLSRSSSSTRQKWHFLAWFELNRGPGIATNAAENGYLFGPIAGDAPTVKSIAMVPDGGSSWEVNPRNECAVSRVAQGTRLSERLDDLRLFRDEVLRPSKAGRRYVGLLQAQTPEILRLLLEHEDLRSAGAAVLQRIAPTALSVSGRRPRSFTAGELKEVDGLLDQFARFAGPRLRETIHGVRRDLVRFKGQTASKGLARLDKDLTALGRVKKSTK